MNKRIIESSEAPSFLKVRKVCVEGFPGGMTKTYEYLSRADSVAVLIYHRDRHLFTWVEQFRIGQAVRDGGVENLVEPVAGMIEPGQTPFDAARREVLEETGVHAADLIEAGSFLMCPGVSSERMYLFVAIVEGQTLYAEGGLPEEQEHITVHHWSAEETLNAIGQGRMDNAHSLLLWNWVSAHRPNWLQL